jgi:hypothetical protein
VRIARLDGDVAWEGEVGVVKGWSSLACLSAGRSRDFVALPGESEREGVVFNACVLPQVSGRGAGTFPPLAKGGGPGGVDGAILSVLGHRSHSDFARAEPSNSVSEAAAHTPLTPPLAKGGKEDGVFVAGEGAQRNRDEHSAGASPTFHYPSLALPKRRGRSLALAR